jgi:uncharacterized protein (DUF433 family)
MMADRFEAELTLVSDRRTFETMEGDYRQFFEVDPAKRGGKPCFKGTRLTPYDILSLMAAGISHVEILQDYPYLTETHLRACLPFRSEPN